MVQHDGILIEHEGEIFKPRKIKEQQNTAKLWEGKYWQAYHSKRGMTFSQAYGFFFHEYHYWPPRNLPLMPTRESDWHRKVKSVPYADLIPKPTPGQQQRKFA